MTGIGRKIGLGIIGPLLPKRIFLVEILMEFLRKAVHWQWHLINIRSFRVQKANLWNFLSVFVPSQLNEFKFGSKFILNNVHDCIINLLNYAPELWRRKGESVETLKMVGCQFWGLFGIFAPNSWYVFLFVFELPNPSP